MRKTNILIALFALSTMIMFSCKDSASKSAEETVENQRQDHKGPPPGGRGERKGPPRGGGSPEQTKSIKDVGGYEIGAVATDFNLKNVDGSMVSLAGIDNAKGYIVVFTCNECPFAKMYEDRLIELHNKYAPMGYSVVAINPNSPENDKEGYAAMQKRAEDKGFPFAYLVDEGQKVYPKYGALRTPHVFLLDKERKVQYIGTIDDNAKSAGDVKVKYLEDAIEALQKGEKPSPNLTKAIGCPIKASNA